MYTQTCCCSEVWRVQVYLYLFYINITQLKYIWSELNFMYYLCLYSMCFCVFYIFSEYLSSYCTKAVSIQDKIQSEVFNRGSTEVLQGGREIVG